MVVRWWWWPRQKWGRSQTYCPTTLDKQTCRNVAFFFVCLFGMVCGIFQPCWITKERVINPGSDFSTSDFPVPPVVLWWPLLGCCPHGQHAPGTPHRESSVTAKIRPSLGHHWAIIDHMANLWKHIPTTFFLAYGDGSKPWYLVNPKIAGKWMFIPLKMYL